ncbi:hypothetical protein CAEBREN_32704 [Caenorhabditis brenneri]|uniref:Serpentine receptor class gamma n=1 Tax=Caenorhabditis brenneri TaxID=135651 RepID=G0PKG2_CAEBE|nr:hypothetical protein CAEBREN_32704 [Caenorhabditis brenneri]
MPQAFNWNDVAYEMAPISQYTDLYSNQPRIYMFEGATIIDLILLLVTSFLTLFWLIFLIRSESSVTKSLITITVAQIFVNVIVRVFKQAAVDTTFQYSLYIRVHLSILASCTNYTREKLAIRCLFFNTVITIMDLLFMVVGITDQFPIPYIVMTTYRYKAFEVTPVFILLAFFSLMSDSKKWEIQKTTTTAEVTTIVTEPPSTSSTTILPAASVALAQDFPVPIPNQIDLVQDLQPQATAPAPTYGNLNYGMGALVVHIQPVSNN